MKYKHLILVIFLLPMSIGCKPTKTSDSTAKETIVTPPQINFTANVFVDNSGSMDGYVNGGTSFKDNLGLLLIKLKSHHGNSSLNLVNTKIHPVANNVEHFISNLNPSALKIGDRSTSNINDIFKMVLDKVSKNKVSILISDCAYAVSGGESKEKLNDAKNLTMSNFIEAQKKNKDLSLIVIKCMSDFDGYYYTRSNESFNYKGKRPYYIFIMGSKMNLNYLSKSIDLTSKSKDLKEVTNRFLISKDCFNFNENSAAIISSDFTNAEEIRALREGFGVDEIVANSRLNEKVQFAVGIDANKIFVDDLYLCDPSNYTVSSQNYIIESIKPIDKKTDAYNDIASSNSQEEVNPYAIVLREKTFFSSSIDISLDYKIPSWVIESTIDDDAGIIPNSKVTFGFSYMIEGIMNAFSDQNSKKKIFNLNFNINNIDR